MVNRCDIVKFIVNNYFATPAKAAQITGYTENQFNKWMAGEKTPQRGTIDYLFHCAFVPEFKVIVEYSPFDSSNAIQTQLKGFLGEHSSQPGLYAFYDGLGRLLYVGKATKLLAEMQSALKRGVHIPFPKGVKAKPTSRAEIVKYVSAYDVGVSKWNDLPKHVESLLLRVSKPLLNKNIGHLARAYHQPKDN